MQFIRLQFCYNISIVPHTYSNTFHRTSLPSTITLPYLKWIPNEHMGDVLAQMLVDSALAQLIVDTVVHLE